MPDTRSEGDDELPIELALAGTIPLEVGSFRFFYADERWEWSPQVERLHGYQPGSVTPTTALIMSHKHPDDVARMAKVLDYVRDTHKPISTRHRVIDAQGRVHDVVVVGQELRDGDGEIIGTHGYYIDVTPSKRTRDAAERAEQAKVSAAVAEIADNRSVIEHAKGMLMLIYGIDVDGAFDLLRWRSQETNVKLRVIAEQIVCEFTALSKGESVPPRSVFDRVLLTAHLRVGDGDAGEAEAVS